MHRLPHGSVSGRRLDGPHGVPEVAAPGQVPHGLARLEQTPLVPHSVAVVGIQASRARGVVGAATLPLDPGGAVGVHAVADGAWTALGKVRLRALSRRRKQSAPVLGSRAGRSAMTIIRIAERSLLVASFQASGWKQAWRLRSLGVSCRRLTSSNLALKMFSLLAKRPLPFCDFKKTAMARGNERHGS